MRRYLKCLLESKLFILNLVLILSFGCSSQIESFYLYPTKNLNNGGNACFVCVYQLRNAQNFEMTTIDSFWQEGIKIFESDLVEKVICDTLIPMDRVRIPFLVAEETNYIGVVADFRNPDREGWRQVYKIPSKRPKEIRITVGTNSLIIQGY